MTMLATEAASSVASADIAGDAAAGGAAKAGSTSQLARRGKGQPARQSKGGGKPAVAQARKVIAGNSQSAGPKTKTRLTGQQQGRGQVQRRSGGSRRKGAKLPALATAKGAAPKTSTLIVEWLVAVLVIFWGVLDGQTDYVSAMSKALWRITALSGVFFVLALVMRGKNTGRVAIAFGAIIDLAVIFQAANNGSIKALSGVFAGTGTGGDKTNTDASEEATQHTLGAGTTLGSPDTTAAQKAAETKKLTTGKPPKKGTPGAPGTP